MDAGEHTYGEIRDVVIDAVRNAGEPGVATFSQLLDRTALELGAREGASIAARTLHPADARLVMDIVWDLVRQGAFAFASPHGFRRGPAFADFVGRGFRRAPSASHLKGLPLDQADISPDSAAYLRESINAFYLDHLLSASVMLGLAAEGEFLKLLRAAQSSVAHGPLFICINETLDLRAKIRQFREAIETVQTFLPKTAAEELHDNLDMISSLIRATRDEEGRPSGALPPSRDRVRLYFHFVISFVKQASRLRGEMQEPLRPQLVRLR